MPLAAGPMAIALLCRINDRRHLSVERATPCGSIMGGEHRWGMHVASLV
jgi:hypothetical protein